MIKLIKATDPWAQHAKVYVDSREVEHCVAASEVGGWAEQIVYEEGKPVVLANDIERRLLTGEVKIVIDWDEFVNRMHGDE